MRKIYGVGGLLLALPLVISFVVTSTREQGISEVPNSPVLVSSSPSAVEGVMAEIPQGANTALTGYVDALNEGLHTGKGAAIRAITLPGCGCRIIADSFELIYRDANLLGGSYQLVGVTRLSASTSEARVRARIRLEKVIHVNRHTGVRETWGDVNIEAIFTLRLLEGAWKVSRTESV